MQSNNRYTYKVMMTIKVHILVSSYLHRNCGTLCDKYHNKVPVCSQLARHIVSLDHARVCERHCHSSGHNQHRCFEHNLCDSHMCSMLLPISSL